MVIRGRRAGRVALLAGSLALATPSTALALVTNDGGSPAPRASVRSSCPLRAAQALPLQPDAVARAATAALAQAKGRFESIDAEGAEVMVSEVGEYDGLDGGYLAHQCGKTVQRRSVVVELRFPKMLPSASLSEGIVYVARFRGGYEVFEVSPIA